MIARPGELEEGDDRVPVVAFLPFMCPKCGRAKPITHRVNGRMRWHKCQECGLTYKSREMRTLAELDEFRGKRFNDPPHGKNP